MPALELNRVGARPLHEQLTDQLIEQAQQLGSGGRLPTEDELVKMYSVSRTTVRRAVQTLVESGLLTRRQGRGTFVGPTHIVQSLDRLKPFLETRSTLGKPPTTRLLDFGWVSGELVPTELRLTSDPSGLRFRRLYSTDGMPHAVGEVTLRADIGKRITRADAESHAAYRLIAGLGIALKEARTTVFCVAADKEMASLLEVRRRDPLLVWRRVSFDFADTSVDVSTHWLRGDVYEFGIVLHPDNATLGITREAGLL